MTPADNNVADAMTGRRDLPPPGVTAAKMSVMFCALAGRYSLDDCSNLRLMGAKGASVETRRMFPAIC